MPLIQILGVLLDFFVLISIEDIVRKIRAKDATADAAVPKVIGSVLIVSKLAIEILQVLTFQSYPVQSFFSVV